MMSLRSQLSAGLSVAQFEALIAGGGSFSNMLITCWNTCQGNFLQKNSKQSYLSQLQRWPPEAETSGYKHLWELLE